MKISISIKKITSILTLYILFLFIATPCFSRRIKKKTKTIHDAVLIYKTNKYNIKIDDTQPFKAKQYPKPEELFIKLSLFVGTVEYKTSKLFKVKNFNKSIDPAKKIEIETLCNSHKDTSGIVNALVYSYLYKDQPLCFITGAGLKDLLDKLGVYIDKNKVLATNGGVKIVRQSYNSVVKDQLLESKLNSVTNLDLYGTYCKEELSNYNFFINVRKRKRNCCRIK
jgi:hypothetical protein